MWLTSTAIRRPVFIVMFVLALVVLGLQSRSKMAKELFPSMDAPFITVITSYSGAGPSEIETLVTEPIEKAVSSIGNLKDVTSTSQQGTSSVMLEFEYGTDVEAAASDVRDKVAAIKASLPTDADEPKVMKMDTSSMPIMTIALAGNLSAKEMRILADNTVSDQLAKIGGVAAVNVSGGEEREIQVAVDKTRLDAYGIGIGSVVAALRSANSNNPAGSIKEGARNYTVRTVGEFVNVKDIASAPIQLTDGTDGTKQVIRVSDVAEIKDTVVEPTKIVRLNGKPSVILSVQKQSGANTVAIAEGIKEELTALQPVLPAGVKPIITMDQSVNVENALEAVNSSLLEGVLLVVLIVFLFLHTARATFIVGLAIPTSLMATYIPTGALGFTQNQMLLLALSLVVGILVDDSIVVLENIERHLRLREHPEEAAISGRSEIGLAAITITMVDIVVFLPIAFMGGMMGMVFRQFGITVACATAFSLLMSFTLTPMLASRWMKSEANKDRDEEAIHERRGAGKLTPKDRLDLIAGTLFDLLERGMRGLDRRYRDALEWALANRFLTIIIGVTSLLVVFAMVMPLSKQGTGPRVLDRAAGAAGRGCGHGRKQEEQEHCPDVRRRDGGDRAHDLPAVWVRVLRPVRRGPVQRHGQDALRDLPECDGQGRSADRVDRQTTAGDEDGAIRRLGQVVAESVQLVPAPSRVADRVLHIHLRFRLTRRAGRQRRQRLAVREHLGQSGRQAVPQAEPAGHCRLGVTADCAHPGRGGDQRQRVVRDGDDPRGLQSGAGPETGRCDRAGKPGSGCDEQDPRPGQRRHLV